MKKKENTCPQIYYSKVFIAALFIIAKSWKQLKCPSTGIWINCSCSQFPTTDTRSNTDESQNHCVKSKKLDINEHKLYGLYEVQEKAKTILH